MLIERKIFGLGGAILAGLLVCANPAQAIIVVDATGQVTRGQASYAKETVTTTATVGTETWYVVETPASGDGQRRLSLRHPFIRVLNSGEDATITYTLTNMQFHGSAAPTLVVEAAGASSEVTATVDSGGAAGTTDVVFSVDADSDTGRIEGSRTLLLEIRALRVNPALPGSIQVQVEKNGNTRPDWTLSRVVSVRKAGVLRESASPVSPITTFGSGFRTFGPGGSVRSDRLAASVGSLDFSVREGSHVASNGQNAALEDVIASGAITFTGDFSFASGVFLDTMADCSSTGSDRTSVTDSGAATRTSTVADANEKHLCIEVTGTTPIPAVASYTASVTYTGVSGAVVPPGGANLALGGIVMGGSVVNIPYVNLNAPPLRENGTYVHRLQVFNRSNEAVAYRINFLPPQGVTVVPLMVEGSFPPGNTAIRLANRDVVTSLSRGSRIALTLALDASPELFQVQTILINTADGSTDTVVYTPE